MLLLKSASGVGIDISLGGLPFEELVVSRATQFEYLPDISLLTCSAEDIVVLKAFADRPRDWEDISGIIVRQESLDWDYTNSQLLPLVEVKEAPHILERLSKLKDGR